MGHFHFFGAVLFVSANTVTFSWSTASTSQQNVPPVPGKALCCRSQLRDFVLLGQCWQELLFTHLLTCIALGSMAAATDTLDCCIISDLEHLAVSWHSWTMYLLNHFGHCSQIGYVTYVNYATYSIYLMNLNPV